jgi:hypothetical protein
MGFYFASHRSWRLCEGYTPTITAREYVLALTEAYRAVAGAWGSHCGPCRQGARLLGEGRADRAVDALHDQVARNPGHESARHLLGLAHLARGDVQAAGPHLELAFDVAQRRLASTEILGEALRQQTEMALLRLLLLSVRIRRGQSRAARALLEDGDPGR